MEKNRIPPGFKNPRKIIKTRRSSSSVKITSLDDGSAVEVVVTEEGLYDFCHRSIVGENKLLKRSFGRRVARWIIEFSSINIIVILGVVFILCYLYF